MAVLDAAAVPIVHVPDRFTGEDIIEKIELIARSTGAVARGECLTRAVASDLAALAARRGRIERPRKALFVLSFINGRPMVAGRATAADGIIRLAGAVNSITGFDGYKLANDESIIAAQPDAVIAMERHAFRLDSRTVFGHPAFAGTPAAAKETFISMDGLYLLGFGPRTARAARDLAFALHPSVGREPMPSEGPPGDGGCGR